MTTGWEGSGIVATSLCCQLKDNFSWALQYDFTTYLSNGSQSYCKWFHRACFFKMPPKFHNVTLLVIRLTLFCHWKHCDSDRFHVITHLFFFFYPFGLEIKTMKGKLLGNKWLFRADSCTAESTMERKTRRPLNPCYRSLTRHQFSVTLSPASSCCHWFKNILRKSFCAVSPGCLL